MASLRESLLYVLNSYNGAKRSNFSENAVAKFIRGPFAKAIAEQVQGAPLSDIFTFKGSAGQSAWAHVPWGAVFHPLVTDTAQKGYYVVYLFRCDMSGVFLSLNQGVTTVQQSYKSDADEALRIRAKDFRARLGSDCRDLLTGDIDLRG